MGKYPLRIVFCAVFCIGGAICLGGCTASVDLTAFVEDEEVTEIIEKGAGTVNITHDSSGGLKAGNKKITGLDPGKYYMVEEWNESGASLGVQFVSANGGRSASLAGIGLVSGREITGLTNHFNYRVKSAEPLTGDVVYKVLTPPSSGMAANTNGAIYLPKPEDDSFIVYTITPPSFPPYEIVEIPISPAGSAKPAMRPSPDGDIITLISRGTVTEYIFLGNNSGEILASYFYILKVFSGEDPNPPTGPGELIITVTLGFSGDNPPGLSPTSVSYPQSDTGTITITVSNPGQYGNNSFKWYIDGTQVAGTGPTFSLNKSQPEYKIVGVYTITVEAFKDGIPYTAAIEVTVTS